MDQTAPGSEPIAQPRTDLVSFFLLSALHFSLKSSVS